MTLLHTPDRQAWDGYVATHPAAQVAHLYDWSSVLAASYRLPVHRLAAVREGTGRISAVLPLLLFAPPRGAARLISLPYTDACGLLADDRQSAGRLLGEALTLAGRLGVGHLEIRQGGEGTAASVPGSAAERWHHTPHRFKTGLRRPLPATTEELWGELSAKVRNQVRKARRSGCGIKIGGAELLTDFYAVFAENMRDLGSPVHAPELFRNLLAKPALGCRLLVVYREGGPAAAAFILKRGRTSCNPWASSLRRQRPSCPNMLLYWSMLALAVESGCRWFDFGRSSADAGTCRFKLQWGAEKIPLVWHVYSRRPGSWDPRSESLCLEWWQRFDLERSRREGPALRRWISL